MHATYVKLFAHVQCIPLDLLLSAEVSKMSSNDRGLKINNPQLRWLKNTKEVLLRLKPIRSTKDS